MKTRYRPHWDGMADLIHRGKGFGVGEIWTLPNFDADLTAAFMSNINEAIVRGNPHLLSITVNVVTRKITVGDKEYAANIHEGCTLAELIDLTRNCISSDKQHAEKVLTVITDPTHCYNGMEIRTARALALSYNILVFTTGNIRRGASLANTPEMVFAKPGVSAQVDGVIYIARQTHPVQSPISVKIAKQRCYVDSTRPKEFLTADFNLPI